ncbi:MAG: phage tail protein [Sphingomonadales bacterium]|nr:phage tail protein [Sphingomonadales bacterium]
MATLVVAVASSLITSAAVAATTRLVGGLFGGGRSRTVEGPRLKDLSVQSSAYGAPIPLVYGRLRVAGNVIWSSGLIETREESTTSQGGKGGGQVTNVTFRYSASFAVGLGGRPIADIRRIWADGKLIREAGGALSVPGSLRVYTGDEAQEPDPLIQAAEGIDNTPAFRGLAYAVLDNLALGEFANRIPNLSFEVETSASGAETGETVIVDLAGRAAETAVDATAMAGTTVGGLLVTGPQPARRALEELGGAFPFAAQEADGAIRFRPMFQASSAAQISEDDLGARQSGSRRAAPLQRARRQELELAREVTVQHIDADRDYQSGAQRARRLKTSSEKVDIRELPLALTASEAKRAAEGLMAIDWMRRDELAFALPFGFAWLDPGDVVDLPDNLGGDAVLISDIETHGFHLTLRGTPYKPNLVTSAATGDGGGGFPGQTAAPSSATVAHILDLPPLRDADTSMPLILGAAAGEDENWSGAGFFISRNGGASYTQVASTSVPVALGVTESALPVGPTAFWDEGNALQIRLQHDGMTLESQPALAVLDGANLALVGDEILQFRDAVQQPDDSYLLSGLLRGRRGTEAELASHQTGERFVLLTRPDLVAVGVDLADVGREVLFKAVSFNQTLSEVSPVSFTYAANNLRPFSPVHGAASRNASGDVSFSWIRRTRIGGGWIDGADVPLGEEEERYEVDILDVGVVVRTITALQQSATYAAAEQIADFGAVQAALDVKIYQISGSVGRGRPWSGTV